MELLGTENRWEESRKMTDKQLKAFMKERNEAVLSFDVQKFRHFYNKWTLLGVYTVPLGKNDRVIEITLRKMALGLDKVPENKKREARKWLSERGLSESYETRNSFA